MTRRNWVWPGPDVMRAVHEEQLAEHGGAAGTRDDGRLESALARPVRLAGHGQPDAADLAAAYGFGIARDHPFIGGNERTAFVAAGLFLELNGFDLSAGDADCVMTMLGVAAGQMDEATFARWLRRHAQKRK